MFTCRSTLQAAGVDPVGDPWGLQNTLRCPTENEGLGCLSKHFPCCEVRAADLHEFRELTEGAPHQCLHPPSLRACGNR